MYETPEIHPRIKEKEKIYIMEHRAKADNAQKPKKTPWLDLATSVPLWAVNIAHCGNMFGLIFLLTQLPLYMSSIIGVNIKTVSNDYSIIAVKSLVYWSFGFVSTALGVSNTVAFLYTTLCPIIVGAMTSDETLGQWISVYWYIFGNFFVCGTIYMIFVSTNVQPWNDNFKIAPENSDLSEQENLKLEVFINITNNIF
ncbi:putative inorganic phosphate cotransporter [Armadillidium nasatum]|uniref:Putative inorganic phosphate cotransporter n=1 Tax=Armadillidium nasatum TaxID=96803 RepID=A0A5N5TF72_9CRUS|nr:putative inorganic phosphate cotransporter [Armadillidium nasatum]